MAAGGKGKKRNKDNSCRKRRVVMVEFKSGHGCSESSK